jgi:elongation factor 1-beta
MSIYTITNESDLATLDAQLKDNLYIGGHSPNVEDALVFEQFAQANTEPSQDKHVNLWSWYLLIVLFTEQIRNSWKAVVPKVQAAPAKKEAKKEEPKAEAPKDEVDDLFGDDGDDAAALEEMKKKKEADKKKPKKDAPVAKSIIIFDVKVWEPEQDLDALAARILEITKEGLLWKTEYKLADVAFGVKKIVMGCVVEDEKVSIDDIIEELESWEDDIQSVDIVSFNKI